MWGNGIDPLAWFLVLATYSDVEGVVLGGTNIDADPLFVDTSADAYCLTSGSPCIDVGDPDRIESAMVTERGTITGGTGIYVGATGTVEIAGFLEACNLGEDFCSSSWAVTPDLPDRGRRFDFNYILRGEIP